MFTRGLSALFKDKGNVAPGGRRSYLPGIDGLRAIAVSAVLLFHGGVAAVGGGFLGVEVFFVVSGYLITLLLLREHARTGRVNLKAFWGRRARRLLPAAGALVAATLLYAVLFLPDEVSGLRADGLSAAGYVTNWWLVFGNQPYFETMGRLSLLQHLWSLAVEEQFYLLWPVTLFVLLRFTGRRGAFAVTLAAAAGSYVLMGVLHNPEADPARVYYGTDTRAGALLAGAALAFLWDPANFRARASRGMRAGVGALAVAGCAALVGIFFSVESGSAWLYPTGFVVTSLATVAVIIAATFPGDRAVSSVLGSAPLRWAGMRSYGLYLWHWPIFVVTRPGLDVPFDGLDLLAGRLVLAGLAAEVSYRFVEHPFRTGAVARGLRAAYTYAPVRARLLSASGGFAAFALVFSVFHAHSAAAPAYLAEGGFHGVVGVIATASPTETSSPTVSPTVSPTATPTDVPPTEVPPTPTEAPTEAPPVRTATPPPATATPVPVPTKPPPVIPPPTGAAIYAIGDSVLMGAAPYLGVAGPVEVDAEVGRQVSGAIAVVRALRDSGRMPAVLVIHTGNNGPLTNGHVDQIMELAGEARVVFVTVRVGRAWESTTNASAWSAAERYPNVRVADWFGATEGRNDLFHSDGIHVGTEGGQLFAAVVAAAIP